MKPGTVLVDVAIDQGGCFETSHPTTHSEPTYVVDGIVHYAVANIPRRCPVHIHHGADQCHIALYRSFSLQRLETGLQRRSGIGVRLNVVEGKVTYKAVADVFGMKYDEIKV